MNLKEQVMDVRETQAYWKGVVAGVIGSAVFFSALITLIYSSTSSVFLLPTQR